MANYKIKNTNKSIIKMRLSKADFKMLVGQTVKLQVVDCGEDARVKIVDFGEDLSYQRVEFGSAQKTIKIRIVTCGEDVKLKEKQWGANFKAIIC